MVGSKLCIAKLTGIQKQITEGLKFAVKQWGDDVMNTSREHYVPVDTGLLKSTGTVSEEKSSATEYTIKLSYSTDYAIFVHEIPAHHEHGTWEYLTTPFNDKSSELSSTLDDRGGKLL